MSRTQVEAFTRQVELVAMIGESEVPVIAATVEECARTAPGPFAETVTDVAIPVLRTAEPVRLVSDPTGYLVVYPDARRRLLLVEHYTNAGALDAVLEGLTPTALYSTIIERGLVSRLDHAAYLGRELARVERCLETGERYVQDRAAGETDADTSDINTSCGCTNPCGDGASR